MYAVRGTLLMLRKEIKKAHSPPYPLFCSRPHHTHVFHTTSQWNRNGLSTLLPSLLHNLHQPHTYTATQQHTNRETTQMTKYNKMWKALRMCSTKAKPENEGWMPFAKTLAPGAAAGLVAGLMGAVHYWYDGKFGLESEYHLDNMLKKIVTAPYEPEVPIGREYFPRQQDGKLEKDLGDNIAKNTYFFMLTGESGSGKTTMMQHLLKKNYKEGVIFVAVNADKLSKVPSNKMRDLVEEAVLKKFKECKDHPRHHPDFTDFIKHANEVRKRAKKEKAHPLIIYITLDTKNAKLSYEVMHDIAVAVGGMASDLSSKQNCCKTILEFSKTGISDNLRQIRGDFDRLEVRAMTEDEFLRIGKQVLAVKDPENLIEPYLKHYHDWLGGQTKTLTQLGDESGSVGIKSMHNLCCLFVQHDY